ncbi:divalent-cation tolerance protein CutA [Azorhizobium doebereinerae]|uniref:divalent-cation tolerance protein CutA n=1 Tax=Azorhizobium doebereinerae TaxID=281091 RepID=UPI00041DEAFD|nr:divalent-cation tolerance protein CutA [Azorhizobium doebereinerae]
MSTRLVSTRLVYATYPSLALAEAAGRRAVEARLAACANILPSMVSIYRWEGAVERAEEVVLLLKTTQALAPRVVEAVRAGHPYEMPAVLVLPVEGGNPAFLEWIAAETAEA